MQMSSGQKEARRSAARTPSLLIAPESFAVLPSRDESRSVSGTHRLSHTEPVCDNEPEVESHLAQSSGSGVARVDERPRA